MTDLRSQLQVTLGDDDTLARELGGGDIESQQQWVIPDSLPHPPARPRSIVASPDGRTLYHGAQQVESNTRVVRKAVSYGR